MQKSFLNKIIFSLGIFFAFSLVTNQAQAAVLLPGNISTCGELAAPGTYTLTTDLNSGADTCFTISSSNVTIIGNAHTITGTGTSSPAIDARTRTGGANGPLTEGSDANTNLVINDLNITGYTTGVDISGNNNTSIGYAGTAGEVSIYYSKVGSINANGGNATNAQFGGLGGNIYFTDVNLDISNSTISALGGRGSLGTNDNGVLDLNYSGTIDRTNVSLSSLKFFNDNTTQYGVYPGGSWTITPGNISTCGTLYGPGTFTLTQSVTSSSTCFYIFSDNVTLNGAGYSITSATTTNTSPAILAGNYSSFTLASTTVTDFSKLITSSSSVAILGNDLDLSNSTLSATNLSIQAGVLNVSTTTLNATTLNVNYTTSVTGTTTAMTSAISSLIINSVNYGAKTAGLLFNTSWIVHESNRQWYSVTSSANGTKLAAVVFDGQIYTSTDSGVTWTARDSNRRWYSVTSSADGIKLAAVVYGGYIYTSTDSGVTWTPRILDVNRDWRSITSSADGTKLAAVVSNGYIYTSTDSGVTWTPRILDVNRDWKSITSSSDGIKLAAVANNGYIYTSTDSGVTWTARDSIRTWLSITSSSDGTKLAASLTSAAPIYISTDSGVTWTPSISSGSRQWNYVTSSSDGTKLAAVAFGGQIYISTDSGTTWTASELDRSWWFVTSSSDGTRLVVLEQNHKIYTYTNPLPTLSVDILRPSTDNVVSSWSPYVSWGIAINCSYSYDGFATAGNTVNCANAGSDIQSPPVGTSTLSVRGIDTTGNTVTKSVTFNYTNQDIQINIPSSGSTYTATTWSPNVTYSLSNQTLSSCYYSYNNFTSTSTANCSLNGTDILPPETNGSNTLSIKTVNASSVISTSNVTFTYQFSFIPNASNRSWQSITSSSDGTKLAAVVYDGYIYTSTDAGRTWIEKTTSGSRKWLSITSSADGTKLAAVEYGYYDEDGVGQLPGKIYTSADSGATWTARMTDLDRSWYAITSSADGTKLAAVVSGGQIYTSTDSGVTWTARDSYRDWRSITSSADGTKLVAGEWAGYIYTSTDSGATWIQRASPGYWNSITSSADGTKLAALNQSWQIYTSTDSGVTWTPRESSRQWKSITSSADGTKLAAVLSNGQIYISTDSGVSWTTRESNRNWYSITSSSDGTKLAGVVYGGKIYTLDISSSDLYIAINTPSSGSNVTSWTAPSVFWGYRKVLCQYSYDGFATTTNTVDCASGGYDIPAPSSYGSATLSVRAVNTNAQISNVDTIFTYPAPVVSSGWIPRDSNRNWRSITSSADGTKLAAVVNSGFIYTSSDGGATWILSESSRQWRSITSSADGTKLAAVVNNGFIYTSTNFGLSWVVRESSRPWRSITSSSDGTKLAAVASSGRIYTSTDSGVNWTPRMTDLNRTWYSITSSSDGTKLAAVVNNGQIYTSTDSGVTWIAREGNRNWYSITSSADGTKLAAVVQDGFIYTSTDGGATWIPRGDYAYWNSITSSADGTKLAAVWGNIGSGPVYISTDSGLNWNAYESNRNWSSITSSADGTKLAAVITSGGKIYTYTNPLPTLSVDILRPSTDNVVSSLSPYVSWGIATSCYYSYNNFTSTSTANCALNGTDITAPPSSGTSTLSVRGIYSTSTVTQSVTFSYTPYYWCGTADSDWSNASNWYTSNACSVNIGSVPGASNGAFLVGTVSPIVGTSTSALPSFINSTGLTGPANTVGIIFASSTVNTTNITGNATFQGTAYNTGIITGNAYFNSASAGTFTLSGSMIWGGSISGTIKGGDNVDITNLIFNNSSSNSTTISGMSAVFNNTASNNGTITGDATFNGTTFRMGTVNGTATLNGISQTISGINSVVNFFKNLFTQSNDNGRDTLYFTSGSTLDVSGLFTLLGTDANNLLTVRSTTPGSYASLGINGSSTTVDFLRIKDIHNTGSLLDLASKFAYDDGGNTGFTFPSNSTPGSRNGNTGNYTAPTLPPSRVAATPSSTQTPSRSTGTNILRNLNPFGKTNFTPLPAVNFFTPQNGTFRPNNVGTTVIPFPFRNFKPVTELVLTPSPKFDVGVSKFLFAPLPSTITSALKDAPKLQNFIAAAGVNSEQSLALLATKPLALKDTVDGELTPGHFIARQGIQPVTTFATYDANLGGLAELIKVNSNQSINISLVPLSTGEVTATYLNQVLTFTKGKSFYSTTLTTPFEPGRYILKTSSSPIPLIIEVTSQQTLVPKPQPTQTKSWGVFNFIWKLFNK